MNTVLRRQSFRAILAALLLGGMPTPGADCNRNGVEDMVEIETPTRDFRLADEIDVEEATSLAAVDFDGDGDDDLVAHSFPPLGGTLVLLRNEGGGRLAHAANLSLPRLFRLSLRSADLDGDSDLDLFFLFPFGVEILWNDRDGSFSRSTTLPVGSGPVAVEAVDLDRDADLDLITANFIPGTASAQNISVLLNEGQESFTPPRNFVSIEEQPVLAVGDLDGDGDADALVCTSGSGTLVLLENDGHAAFHAAGPTQRVPFRITFLTSADIDGDGRDEVVALDRPPSVLVLSHAGGGQFEVKNQIKVPGIPSAILTQDLTGDGRAEIVVPSSCPDLTIFEGGPGGLLEPRSFWLGIGNHRLISADLNGDDLPDLAGGLLGGKVLAMLQERSTLSRDCDRNGIPDECEPDCDRNGSPDVCDLSSGASPDCDANGIPDACDPDCDGNGHPDACDIGAGKAADCNGNGVPDGCERSLDADGNGSPDACDIARDPSLDCDGNGKLDEEDLEPRLRFVEGEEEVGAPPVAVCLADMDGDGDQDIVTGGLGEGISILEQTADGVFAKPRTYPVEAFVNAIAAIDADRDGDLDLAVSTRDQPCEATRGWVALLVNHGGFRLGRGPAYILATAPAFLEPADLDGDGILDLLASHAPPSPFTSRIWVLAGHGDGTFANPLRIAEKGGGLALADLDGDGDIDIATCDGILLNQGAWAFVEGPPLASECFRVAARDIDGDSDADLILQTRHNVSVLVNDGKALFTPGEGLQGSMTGPFALGNFDGDGRADIALARSDQHAAVSVFLSLGTGFAAVEPAASIAFSPEALVGGDVDGDGLDDVVALFPYAGSVIVLPNQGSGRLSSRAGFALDQALSLREAGDIDGDLDLDIAGLVYDASGGGARIALFENDGNASYTLKTILLHDHTPRLLRLADVTGDGELDILLEEVRGDGAMVFSVLRGKGGWTFDLEFRDSPGLYVEDMAVADFDADGDLDVVRLQGGGSQISIILNSGGSAWGESMVTLTGPAAMSLHVANVDGDGLPDVLVAALEEIRVHRGTGTGGFMMPADVVSLPGNVTSADAADLDRDGDDDLVVGRIVGDCALAHPNCWRFDVFLSVAGILTSSDGHAVDGPIHDFAPADLDGDGDLDLLASIDGDPGNSASHVRLLMSSRQGLRLGGRISFQGYDGLVPGDLDGDGDTDIAIGGGVGFFVLRNDTTPPALHDADRDGVPDGCERAPFSRGDADQDGSLSLGDAVAVLHMLFQGAPLPDCPSALDADDSGALDITDPVRILGHLFLGRGPLPDPFAACGSDPTPDSLACSEFAPCA